MYEEIRDLLARTAQTRYQFLIAELQTCLTALELGSFQFSVGNLEIARREVAVVETGIRTIEYFLAQVSLEQKIELQAKLLTLKWALYSLIAKLR